MKSGAKWFRLGIRKRTGEDVPHHSAQCYPAAGLDRWLFPLFHVGRTARYILPDKSFPLVS
jgi:hypothetical protein